MDKPDSKVQAGAAKKLPPNAGKGRRKGVPNKVTADVKEMVLAALQKAGGADYMLSQAKANPAPFLALVGKLLPKDVTVTASVEHKAATAQAVAEMMARLFKAPGPGGGQ